MRLYNTLTKNIEEFKPAEGNHVRLYCCGPTVYNYAHIGNLRTYIFEDILVKTLKLFGFEVTHVMNITDVGHLASDADEGEDKMLLAMKKEHKKSHEIAEFYTDAFFNDCAKLNIQKPTITCKATDHIQEMIKMIQTLIQKGFAYASNGNVYFDVEKNKDYGKLAGLSLESLLSGARIEVDTNKKNPHDFALWFTKSKFENQELQWDSPWGVGYPGWHIECSAMATKFLGDTLDIHCGGIDHIPVHHTNEIAQSECCTGKPFSRFWLHGGFLVESNSQKMSKSKGEFLTLNKLEENRYNALSYRFLCLTAHYRGELSWSWEALSNAKNSLQSLIQKVSALLKEEQSDYNDKALENWKEEFKNKIGNDLNTPQALAVIFDAVSDKSLNAASKLNLVSNFDQVLSLNLIENAKDYLNTQNILSDNIPQDILNLALERDLARKNRKFEQADYIRNQLESQGYEVKDTTKGPIVTRKQNEH